MLRPLLLLCLAAALCVPAAAQKPAESDTLRAMRAEQAFVRGMTRAYLGDYEAAIQQYERALELQPGEAAVLAALAEAHEAESDLSTALYFATQAVEAAPDEPSTYRQLASLQLTAGETGAAMETYERLLELEPRDLATLTALARVQQQSGRMEEALVTYERVLDRVGENGAVRTRMLGIYERLGDTGGAIRSLEALTDLDPSNAVLRRQLASLYARDGRTGDAITTLEALVVDRPGDADARTALADLYRDEGDDDRAEALLGTLGEPSASPDATFGQAAALYARADEDPAAASTARRLLETLWADGTADARALLLLGDLRYRDGDWTEAAEALQQALYDEPGNPPAWVQLVAAHLRAGNTEYALDAADEATLLFPGQVALLRVAALANAAAGRLDEAVRLFEEAIDLLVEATSDASERDALLEALDNATGLMPEDRQRLRDKIEGTAP